jgi:hypothetical protein
MMSSMNSKLDSHAPPVATNSAHAVAPHLNPNLADNAPADCTPIALAATAAMHSPLVPELQRTLAKPDVAERLAKLGAEAVTDAGPAKLAAMVKGDSARWAALIRDRKISAE